MVTEQDVAAFQSAYTRHALGAPERERHGIDSVLSLRGLAPKSTDECDFQDGVTVFRRTGESWIEAGLRVLLHRRA